MQQHNTLEFTYKAKTDILVIFIYTHYPAKNEYVCVYGICTCHGVKYMYNYPIPTQQINYFLVKMILICYIVVNLHLGHR